MEQYRKVSIHLRAHGSSGMDNEKPREPKGLLGHGVMVGVVHVSPILKEGKFIDVGLSRWDGRVREPADAIHSRGNDHPMPMDCCRRWQFIGNVNANSIPLNRLDGWPVHSP